MGNALDPLELAEALIACPSVTPATGAVFDRLEEMLAPLGFALARPETGWVTGNVIGVDGGEEISG